MDTGQHRPVLFFDGVCNLCTRAVQFVLKHDKKQRFLFASLQSANGMAAQQAVMSAKGKTDTLILLHKNKYYTRSDAALRTAGLLGGAWRILTALLIFPAFARNWVYNIISRNRYKWFGRQDKCMVPTPELRQRFLD